MSLKTFVAKQRMSAMVVKSTNTHTYVTDTVLLNSISNCTLAASIMPSGAKTNDQYQYKLSMAEQIEELKKKRELLGLSFPNRTTEEDFFCFSW